MNSGSIMNRFSVIDQPIDPQRARAWPFIISQVRLQVYEFLPMFQAKMIFFLKVFLMIASSMLQLLISTTTDSPLVASLKVNLPPDSSSLNSSYALSKSKVFADRINLLYVSSPRVQLNTFGKKTSCFLPERLISSQSMRLLWAMISWHLAQRRDFFDLYWLRSWRY